jgi:putative flippase GtrA
MTANSWSSTATRWLKFNLVGGMGIGVQLLLLIVLKSVLHIHYLVATALAVEAPWSTIFSGTNALPGQTAPV